MIILSTLRHYVAKFFLQYNIFNRIAGGRAITHSESCGKVVIIMSTYEELSLIVSVALLIVAILNMKNKK